jgi:hypothetical protein
LIAFGGQEGIGLPQVGHSLACWLNDEEASDITTTAAINAQRTLFFIDCSPYILNSTLFANDRHHYRNSR